MVLGSCPGPVELLFSGELCPLSPRRGPWGSPCEGVRQGSAGGPRPYFGHPWSVWDAGGLVLTGRGCWSHCQAGGLPGVRGGSADPRRTPSQGEPQGPRLGDRGQSSPEKSRSRGPGQIPRDHRRTPGGPLRTPCLATGPRPPPVQNETLRVQNGPDKIWIYS